MPWWMTIMSMTDGLPCSSQWAKQKSYFGILRKNAVKGKCHLYNFLCCIIYVRCWSRRCVSAFSPQSTLFLIHLNLFVTFMNVHPYLRKHSAWQRSENMRVYLSLRGIQGSPVVGSELVKLVELEANVLDWKLKHIPEASEVGGHGTRVGVWILEKLGQGKV